jgi:hypothetical protein
MRYPYIPYHPDITVSPVFHDLKGEPYILDLSSNSRLLSSAGADDQAVFQKLLDKEMIGYTWGLSSYLEERELLLHDCPQMVREKRFYHLGLDVIVPAGTVLHAPLPGTVHESGYEAGRGNYGGYVILHHDHLPCEPFYSVYGHLKTSSLPNKGCIIEQGEQFARTGEFDENGGWFYHTHIQILTQSGMDAGMKSKGYCSEELLKDIPHLCPSPYQLFVV